MKMKKWIYTAIAVPMGVATFGAFRWQARRKIEKEHEIERRYNILKQHPLDISPHTLPLSTWVDMPVQEFKEKYSHVPIKITGHFDLSKRVLVDKFNQGKEGAEIISPLYIDKDSTILVNRGWIPRELQEQNIIEDILKQDTLRMKYNEISGFNEVEGVLYRGDGENKYTLKNVSGDNKFHIVQPKEISAHFGLNIDLPVLVKIVDFDGSSKNSLPKKPEPGDLCYWYVTPEVHQSYSNFWLTTTGMIIGSLFYIWIS